MALALYFVHDVSSISTGKFCIFAEFKYPILEPSFVVYLELSIDNTKTIISVCVMMMRRSLL